MSALRLARGVTGRHKILKFEGCYHGHADGLLVAAGSGVATLGIPDSPGVPAGTVADTLTAPFNDLPAVERALDAHGRDLAASSSSRSSATWAALAPREGFLEGLRRLSHRVRRAADLRRGDDRLPAGARAARRSCTASRPTSPAWARSSAAACRPPRTAGPPRSWTRWRRSVPSTRPARSPATRWRWPRVPCCSTTWCVRATTSGSTRSTIRLQVGLSRAAQAAGVMMTVNRVGSMFTPFFCRGPVTDYASAKTSDTALFGRFFHGMLERGVYLPPAQFEAAFMSLAHTERDIDQTVAAAADALKALARA